MTPALIQLDFATQRPPRLRIGLLLLCIGVAAGVTVMAEYDAVETELAVVDLQTSETRSAMPDTTSRPVDERTAEEVREARALLAVPWSQLFGDLERANLSQKESVALLQIEPDVERAQVRVAAEAASLPTVLEYVRNLGDGTALAFPTLDRHEIRTDVRERPVYFELTAKWGGVAP